MSTATATQATTAHLQSLRFTRGATRMMLDGITPEQICAQPGPCVNHALWTVGHLAVTDDYFIGEFAGQKASLAAWNDLFGMGSTPTSDATKYPSLAEIMKVFDERRAVLEKWIGALTAAQLATTTPEAWRPYAPMLGDIPFFVAWHEGYHQGELAVLRKALGLARAFG